MSWDPCIWYLPSLTQVVSRILSRSQQDSLCRRALHQCITAMLRHAPLLLGPSVGVTVSLGKKDGGNRPNTEVAALGHGHMILFHTSLAF